MEEEGKDSESRVCVCVTGASGFVGSRLVMNLLQQGYVVRATVRNPEDMKKVKCLVDLPNASTQLSLWKADLNEEGSFDEAICGCAAVFNVATSVDYASVTDPENEYIKPTINGVLNVMRSCLKAQTVKRLIYTSTVGTISAQQPPPPHEYNESFWTDTGFCKAQKMQFWMYAVAKTMAEKAAWEFAKQSSLDLVTIHPPLVIGPSVTTSSAAGITLPLALIRRNEALYPMLVGACAVHVDDLCMAHIHLLEHPQAKGRYICSSHCFTISDLATSLSLKYPEYHIPTKFEGVDESLKPIPYSSKKLLDTEFQFKYSQEEYHVGDLFATAIESCKEKGLLPLPSHCNHVINQEK